MVERATREKRMRGEESPTSGPRLSSNPVRLSGDVFHEYGFSRPSQPSLSGPCGQASPALRARGGSARPRSQAGPPSPAWPSAPVAAHPRLRVCAPSAAGQPGDSYTPTRPARLQFGRLTFFFAEKPSVNYKLQIVTPNEVIQKPNFFFEKTLSNGTGFTCF